jgi:hypothetical protein
MAFLPWLIPATSQLQWRCVLLAYVSTGEQLAAGPWPGHSAGYIHVLPYDTSSQTLTQTHLLPACALLVH